MTVAIQTAQANPIGGTVVSGEASFTTSGSTLTVINTPGTIINWQGFSIGSNEITNFAQQSASSTVLNRVVGSDPSSILGTLQSNGRVFLINPNGIMFGAGAVVDVAGLVASTLNLSDADFIAGNNRFTEVTGAGNVSNAGNITAQEGGQIYLIAPNVENTGVITAPNGEILLAAGANVELVNTNDPNLRVSITAPAGDATNIGQLIAASGSLGLFGTVVKNSGTISADSATMQGGKIVLRASQLVEAAGTISASGTTGGNIAVLGNQVAVLDGAMVSANGTEGGGTILIGGDAHGANPEVQNAQVTYVAPTATISADATQTGDGGKVVVWADNATQFGGHISARGGAVSGNGGWVEVSGKQWLDYAGLTDTTAANGMVGSLLLDPTDITIGVGTNSTNMLFNPGTLSFSDVIQTPSTLNVGNLITQLASSNVTVDSNSVLTGTGNITVADSLAWNSPNTLTLKAAGVGSIFVNVNISTGTPLSINVAGGGSLVLQTANGSISIDAANGVNISDGGAFTANAGGATSNLNINSAINTGTGAINLSAGQNIMELAGGSLTTTGLLTTKSDTGTTLNGANAVGSFSATNTGSGIISLTNTATNLTVLGISQTAAGEVTLSNSGNITPTGAVTAGTFTLSGGTWNQVSATLSGFTVNDFRLSGGTFIRALGGDGSAGSPYQLTDIYGVQGIDSSAVMLGNNYVLANNIDASGTANWDFGQGFVPIGNSSQVFSGTFDGQNHTISNFTINRPSASNVGLFGQAGGFSLSSSISNVGLVNPVVAGGWTVGALAGNNRGLISNSYVSGGSVTGNVGVVGGLVGYNLGTIDSGRVYGGTVVNGSLYDVGGLVGYNDGSEGGGVISNSYFSGGSVTGTSNIGGLVGYNFGGSISNSYVSGGSVVGDTKVGGLVGFNLGGYGSSITVTDATISSSHVSGGTVSGLTNVGGLVGLNQGGQGGNGFSITTGMPGGNAVISNSYVSGGTVSGFTNVGGVVGQNIVGLDGAGSQPGPGGAAVIVGSYANAGSVIAGSTSGSNVGGLVGYNIGGDISSSYVSGGIVAGGINVGGLVGSNQGENGGGSTAPLPGSDATISNSYVSGGIVVGASNVGGLVGQNIDGTTGIFQEGTAIISNSDASGGTVSATSSGGYAGGLVGYNGSTISSSFVNGGSVNAACTDCGGGAGGLAGYNGGAINTSYASNGSVGGAHYDGGLVGHNDITGTISNSYASGFSVVGLATGSASWIYVGGLVGNNTGTIDTSYASSGTLSGGGSMGGLVGFNDAFGVVSNNFWNTTTTAGVSFGIGFDSDLASGADIPGGVTGMNDANMKTMANFNSATVANGNLDPGWNISSTLGANSTWLIRDGITTPFLSGIPSPFPTVTLTVVDEIVDISNPDEDPKKPEDELIVEIPTGSGGDSPALPICS